MRQANSKKPVKSNMACRTPFCDNPVHKTVHVSLNSYGDKFSVYCVQCESAYVTGVQHGKMCYGLSVQEINDLITCVEAEGERFEYNSAAWHDHSAADQKKHRLMVHGLRKKLLQIRHNLMK